MPHYLDRTVLTNILLDQIVVQQFLESYFEAHAAIDDFNHPGSGSLLLDSSAG
jgi:hypothetical protein